MNDMPSPIKLVVVRCAVQTDNRVRYHEGGAALIGEELVLRRWKDRSQTPYAMAAGTRYDGCRLRPGTCAILQQWFNQGLSERDATNPEVLRQFAERSRTRTKLRAPAPEKFAALIAYLRRRGKLRAMVSRRRDPKKPGIPDLFLYMTDRQGRVQDGRFAEVKRWNRI
jgi:hypothetical protein